MIEGKLILLFAPLLGFAILLRVTVKHLTMSGLRFPRPANELGRATRSYVAGSGVLHMIGSHHGIDLKRGRQHTLD